MYSWWLSRMANSSSSSRIYLSPWGDLLVVVVRSEGFKSRLYMKQQVCHLQFFRVYSLGFHGFWEETISWQQTNLKVPCCSRVHHLFWHVRIPLFKTDSSLRGGDWASWGRRSNAGITPGSLFIVPALNPVVNLDSKNTQMTPDHFPSPCSLNHSSPCELSCGERPEIRAPLFCWLFIVWNSSIFRSCMTPRHRTKSCLAAHHQQDG